MDDPIRLLLLFSVALVALLIIFGRKAERNPVMTSLMGMRADASRTFARRASSGSAEVWSAVASRLGGELLSSGDDHRVRFKWQGRDAMVFEGDPVRFEVAGSDFGPLRAMLHLGSSAGRRLAGIPESISLAEGDEADVRAFLTAPVAQLLRDLLASGATRVQVSNGLRITARLRRDEDAVIRFCVLCLQLAQNLKLFASQTSGVMVVETRSSSSGQCQVCGAELEGKLVRCRRCSTPHHADCWVYAGTCSTYGCGEKTFVG